MTDKFSEYREKGGCVTWVNHFSVQVGLELGVDYSKFDLVGIDGNFLRILISSKAEQTSADRTIPKILEKTSRRVLLVGGTQQTALDHDKWFRIHFPEAQLVGNVPGLSDVSNVLPEVVKNLKPEVVILGLGPGLQDVVALELKSLNEQLGFNCLILTCGGWLDQLSKKDYFPKWGYALRINWLLRLMREPKRLWRRYTSWAWRAIVQRVSIRKALKDVRWLS